MRATYSENVGVYNQETVSNLNPLSLQVLVTSIILPNLSGVY